jgi:tRNA1(Val) A37 N6-methylase TrmN6
MQKEGERLDDLQFEGLRILQNPKGFCFGTDAVLLSHFAVLKKGDRAADLGTGTGIVPILLAGRAKDITITGLEIQGPVAEMARRSIELNGLAKRISVITGDIRDWKTVLGSTRYTLVLSNPPYKKAGSGRINRADGKAVARHELLCTLEDVLEAAAGLLISGGRFAMVHRPERLMDILIGMRAVKLAPKRMQLVHPRLGSAPSLVLVEGVYQGRPALHWMPPLFIYDASGAYTEEMRAIYHMKPAERGEERG